MLPIKDSTSDEHKEMIDVMRPDIAPKVGIFWYDAREHELVGVLKKNAEQFYNSKKKGTLSTLHQSYCKKIHFKAIAEKDTDNLFYKSGVDYTQIPRGRVFINPDRTFTVTIGHWISGYDNAEGEHVDVNPEEVMTYILDEFSLPEDKTEFLYDIHWEIGHGWSELGEFE